jgi:GGDEF domain-containing protein
MRRTFKHRHVLYMIRARSSIRKSSEKGSMSFPAGSIFPSFTTDNTGRTRRPRIPHSAFTSFRRDITSSPFALLVLGSVLIAAHLLLVIFQPKGADGYVYIVDAIASAMEAAVLLIHARYSSGQLSLRWTLLALGFCFHFATYIRGAVGIFSGNGFPILNVLFQVLCGSCFVFALTLPSQEERKAERFLDVSVVIAFCVVRFLFLQIVVPAGSAHNIERMTLESGVRMLLALLALLAASSTDRTFYRCAAFTMATMFLGIVLSNEVGVTLFRQEFNSPWFLTDTVERVTCAVYFFYALSKRDLKVEAKPYSTALSSIVPFMMTAFVVFLSTTLLPDHPYVGYMGVAFGVAAFLLRVGFMSRHRQPGIVIEEGLVREIASEMIKDPLYGLADRYGLEPALALARPSVNVHAPLALILFAIEETEEGVEVLTDEAENHNLVPIARALNNWTTPDSTICYLSRGRFAMLLPGTPLRIAMSLAEQICLNVDSLDLTGEDGPMAIMAGVAACTEPSRVSGLLHTSSAALERAQVYRESRVRCTPLRGEALFDA